MSATSEPLNESFCYLRKLWPKTRQSWIVKKKWKICLQYSRYITPFRKHNLRSQESRPKRILNEGRQYFCAPHIPVLVRACDAKLVFMQHKTHHQCNRDVEDSCCAKTKIDHPLYVHECQVGSTELWNEIHLGVSAKVQNDVHLQPGRTIKHRFSGDGTDTDTL